MSMQSFPASYHQERLWFIDDFENGTLYPAAPVYHNLPVVLRINGRLDEAKAKRALGVLIGRHEALRTMIRMEDEQVLQCIATEAPLHWERLDRHELSAEDAVVRELSYELIHKPFRIGEETLFRAGLIELKTASILVLTAHHLMADRRSMQLLLEEFITVYQADGQPVLPDPALQYADFSAWQKSFSTETIESLMFFWREKLHDIEPLIFHTDFPREQVHIYESGILQQRLDPAVSLKIAIGPDARATFMTAFSVLMHKYSGQQDIVLGTFTANRNMEGLEGVIGPVANLLVHRQVLAAQQNMGAAIVAAETFSSQAVAYAAMPFDKLVTELNPKKDMSRTALFDVLFHYEDRTGIAYTIDHVSASVIELNLGLGKYDFNILVVKDTEGYEIHLTYNKLYYKPETAARLMGHYMQLLAGWTPDEDITALAYVTEQEQAEIRSLLDHTAVAWPEDATLVSLFEKQVALNGSCIALIAGDTEMTYAELDSQVNRLACFLADGHAVLPGDHVALLLPRDERQVIAMLAVLKCGAAYVPVDVEYPEERIRYTLDDCGARICIDETLYAGFLDNATNYDAKHPGVAVTPQDLAYIIYTSGSTGQPKGAMLEHRNVVRLLFHDAPLFDFGKEDVWTLFHSYCFDFSVWEMYGALLLGGTLIVVPKQVAADPTAFLDLLVEKQVTVLNQTPSAFYNLLHAKPWERPAALALRYVIFGGEALHPKKLADWNQHYPAVKLINMYGITETTVHVTYKEITHAEIATDISNIGVPIPTLSAYLLDARGNMVPRLIPGEMWIGGDGLGRGYLNQDTLTKKKFIPNPFGPGRLYASGDLARLSSSGELEYLGRIDNQVKIRGFRIELGEVEKALLKKPEILEALVVARKDTYGGHELVAYYTATEPLPVADLMASLNLFLPHYMLPAYCIQVDAFRLNNNGKIDRTVLPAVDPGSLATGSEYVAPRNEMESRIVAIWEEILERNRIGIYDDFFALGGHSIKAIQILNAYQKEFGVRLTMRDLFENLVLVAHATLIAAAGGSVFEPITPAPAQDSYPLSTAQQRLWILSQFEEASVAYNMPSCFPLDDTTDIPCFKQAVLALIDRHEALRTVFRQDAQGQVRQQVCTRAQLGLEIAALDFRHSEQANEAAMEYMRKDAFCRFDLATGPLLRVALLRVTDNRYFFYYNLHHIISDGWSGKIINRDLRALYTAYLEQQQPVLPGLTIQYKDYAVWQERQLALNTFKEHQAFWMGQFEEELPKLNLMIAGPRPNIKTFNGAMVNGTIPATTLALLQQLVVTTNTSVYVNLLGVIGLLLYRYSYQKEIVIGTPVAGRMHRNLEDIVGFFVNTVALKLSLDTTEAYTEFSAKLKHNVLRAFDYQDYPFDLLIDELHQGKDLSRSPLFDVMLILNEQAAGQEAASEAEDGLLENLNSKYDLSFVCNTAPDRIDFSLIYNTDLFRREDIEKMSGDFLTLLASVVQDPDRSGQQHVDTITAQEELAEQTAFFDDINAAMSDDF